MPKQRRKGRSSWRKWLLLAIAIVILAGFITPSLMGLTSRVAQPQVIPQDVPRFQLYSPSFANGSYIPTTYTYNGSDISPPLEWSGAPKGTTAYALVMVDLDSSPPGFVHWILYDIPGNATGIPAGLPALGAIIGVGDQGVNEYGGVGYSGPNPPSGSLHEYAIILYALDEQPNLPPGYNEQELLQAIQGSVIGVAVLVGYY